MLYGVLLCCLCVMARVICTSHCCDLKPGADARGSVPMAWCSAQAFLYVPIAFQVIFVTMWHLWLQRFLREAWIDTTWGIAKAVW